MTATIKKLGATLAVLATVCFNPIPASAQETDLTTQLDTFDPATADPVMPTTSLDELRHPAERDIYDVDTSDWDFNEPGVNKNNIDNHYYEQLLPTDLGEPQPQIIDGQMRSDRITLPDTVTKHEADQAEVMEAKEQQPQLRAMAADNCRTYWPRPHQVCGAIKAKYESLAVAWAGQTPLSFLGLPKSGELTNPDGVGKRTEFDNGFIYWHPDTGAWSVTTHNSIVWARNGWEQGRLGYPTSDEIGTGDGVGRKQSFQRGRIYTSLSGVVSIEGKILEKWIETGEEKGPLGYPATDEEGTPDGVGRFNRFARGMIYWHPKHGAHPIFGLILFKWSQQGYENSAWGYPVSDPFTDEEGYPAQQFEYGTLRSDLRQILEDYDCLTEAAQTAIRKGITGAYSFMCSPYGVSVEQNDPPSTKNAERLESQRAQQNVASQPIGIECNRISRSKYSQPILRSKHSVAKSISTCIGFRKSINDDDPGNWSRNFDWTIEHTLDQRQHSSVKLKVNSLDLPPLHFGVEAKLMKDIPRAFDAELSSHVVDIYTEFQSTAYDTSFDLPPKEGIYYIKVTRSGIEIPKWNFKAGQPEAFTVGRFECPPYPEKTSLCFYPSPVDDHL